MADNGLGERIRALLSKQRMTQRQLAEKVGATESAVSKYLKGEREPRAEVLAKIATALGTTSEYLLGRQEGITTEFGTILDLCARSAPGFTDEQRQQLAIAILSAPREKAE